MKTIFVIYTNKKLDENNHIKRYCFNIKDDIKLNDMIKSNNYSSAMQVVSILPKTYIYYNDATGELSNELNSTLQREIRTIEIREDNDKVIYGKLLNETAA